MTTTLKYNLQQIIDISNSGFHFEIPKDTYNKINYLCAQVGSIGINSNIFIKTQTETNQKEVNKVKKRRGNKGMEVSAEEWESIRTFQTTKIEQKSGIEASMNEVRSYLNKLTNDTFLDIREKLITKIDAICIENTNNEDIQKLGTMIYDLCSTNKFYSHVFASLFAELSSMYKWLNEIFTLKYATIMEQYNNIYYVDSEKDYDGFCEMNKNNEKRRAITAFYLNLALCGFIKQEDVVMILKNILKMIMSYINDTNKKNEVDELTEIVGVLYNKPMINNVVNGKKEYEIDEKSIQETLSSLAKKKAKDYPSLSNKSIFKYMDLVEM